MVSTINQTLTKRVRSLTGAILRSGGHDQISRVLSSLLLGAPTLLAPTVLIGNVSKVVRLVVFCIARGGGLRQLLVYGQWV